MEFQVIYSRKIQGAVMLFTAFMFACQYGLTRETVAENFSRTGICWSEFALNVVFSILLIFLVWDDDYILSDESITFRRVIFCKKHKWSEFPYCGICYKKNENADDRNEKLLYFSNKPESDSKFEKVYHVIEYTPEIEAIFQIYCPQMPDLDWEFWKNELMGTKMWEDAVKLASNYYVPVVMLVGAIAFTYSPFIKKWHNKVKELTREYQRAALCQLIAERCT